MAPSFCSPTPGWWGSHRRVGFMAKSECLWVSPVPCCPYQCPWAWCCRVSLSWAVVLHSFVAFSFAWQRFNDLRWSISARHMLTNDCVIAVGFFGPPESNPTSVLMVHDNAVSKHRFAVVLLLFCWCVSFLLYIFFNPLPWYVWGHVTV